MAICVECEFQYEKGLANFPECQNPDLSITDFVYGRRDCNLLNLKGNCKGFKAKPKLESIYESKEDEELAKTK